ncbi:hypothetical protein BJV82DRAFT_653986 [Fennellomyces sp. T-0311]|nr:hypothetical protein BJV82DRAFT_653986 [Fennellomyces sp. T-0311]
MSDSARPVSAAAATIATLILAALVLCLLLLPTDLRDFLILLLFVVPFLPRRRIYDEYRPLPPIPLSRVPTTALPPVLTITLTPPPTVPLPPFGGHHDDDSVVEVENNQEVVSVPVLAAVLVSNDGGDHGDDGVVEELVERFGLLCVDDEVDVACVSSSSAAAAATTTITSGDDDDDAMRSIIERLAFLCLLDEDIEIPDASLDEDTRMVRAPPLGPEHMVVDQPWPVLLP